MTLAEMRQLTHEARLAIAEDYRLGKRIAPLDAVMIRLIVQSLYEEREREMSIAGKAVRSYIL